MPANDKPIDVVGTYAPVITVVGTYTIVVTIVGVGAK